MNNGSKEITEKAKKMCPFMGKWCIEGSCTLFIPVTHQQINTLGMRQAVQAGMCALPALAMIMSNKPQPAPMSMRLPPLNKG